MVARATRTGGYTPSEEHIVITSSSYTGGGTPVVVWHGGGDGGDQYDPIAQRQDLHRLANLGLVVCAADLGGLHTWGIDAAGDACDAMLDWLASPISSGGYAADISRVVMIADSHGALGLLNWAVRNPTLLAAGVMRVPAVALQRLYERNVAGLASTIAGLYGSEAALVAAYPTHDPSHPTMAGQIVSLGLAPRLRCYYNLPDPVVLADEVEDFCSATGIELFDLGGPSHSPWEYVDAVEQSRWIMERLG